MAEESSIYESLPEQPELAFVYLDNAFLAEVVAAEQRGWGSDGGVPNSVYIEYIGKVLATRSELDIDILAGWISPTSQEFSYSTYLSFRQEVVEYRTKISIRFGRRTRTFSARLAEKDKRTVRHYIAKIRDILDKSTISDKKKDALLDKLAAFQNEVDRDRTRLEMFGAAIVEIAGYFGDAAEAADVHRLANSIAKVIWGAKDEEMKELPPPALPKRLDPPEKAPKTSLRTLADELDDEIPF